MYHFYRVQRSEKACYKSLLYHDDLKVGYFSVAMAVYFWMVIYIATKKTMARYAM